MITITDLTKSFGDHTVLNSLSLKLPDHGLVIIKGENGSGKSTLLNILAGLDRDYVGHIDIDGKNFASFTSKQICDYQRHYVSYVFQKDNLISFLSQKDNLNLNHILEGKKGSFNKDKNRISSLSQGQQKMLSIDRCLKRDSKIYLLDEVTSSLDDINTENFFKRIKKLSEIKLVILVSHDIRLAQEADLILSINKGNLIIQKGNVNNYSSNIAHQTTDNISSKAKITAKFFLKSQRQTCFVSFICFILTFILSFLSYLGSMVSYMDPYPYLKSYINSLDQAPQYVFTTYRKKEDQVLLDQFPDEVYQSQRIRLSSEKENEDSVGFLVLEPTVKNDGTVHVNSATYEKMSGDIRETFSIIIKDKRYSLKYTIDDSVINNFLELNYDFINVVEGNDISYDAAIDLPNSFWNTTLHTGAYFNSKGTEDDDIKTSMIYLTKEKYEELYDDKLDFEVGDDEIYTNKEVLITEGKTYYPELYYKYDDYYICNMQDLFPHGFYTKFFSSNTVRNNIAIISNNSMKRLLSIFPRYDFLTIKIDARKNNILKSLAENGYEYIGALNVQGKDIIDDNYLIDGYGLYLMALNISYNSQNKAAYMNLAIYCPICTCLLEVCFSFLLVSMQIKNLRILKSFGVDKKRLLAIIFIPALLVSLFANIVGYFASGLYLLTADSSFIAIPYPSIISYLILISTIIISILSSYVAYLMVKKNEKISF